MDKTPEELFAMAGYDLYVCHTEEDIQEFKKYYTLEEELCTFVGDRLKKRYIFFAIKKNVGEIRREDFKNPDRQDAYGTSVISIQFTKDATHTLSICNRYNHTVDNPDATFSNNLDLIIEGLTASFAKYYGLEQKYIGNYFYMKNYIKADDGKIYKYNFEFNGIYYCPNNVMIKNGVVKRLKKSEYIVFDYYVLVLKKELGETDRGRLYNYDTQISSSLADSFPDTIGEIKKVVISKEGYLRKICITPVSGEIVTILLNSNHEMVGYENPNVVSLGDYFMWMSGRRLQYLSLQNVEKMGILSLVMAKELEYVSMPHLKTDIHFFANLKKLTYCDVPILEQSSGGKKK